MSRSSDAEEGMRVLAEVQARTTPNATVEDVAALVVEMDARQGELMLKAVYDFLGRFVAYPNNDARVAHALWIIHAHLMDRWESTPRIAFLSPEPSSGKTRAMEVTELLVPSPVMAVNVSPAYLFRKVGSEDGVTILFDEIDTVFGPKAKENEEIRGLLNAGHRRGAVAGRCVVQSKTVVTEEIPAYSAVALAGLGWLPDTILTRSVIVRMRRRHAGEQIEQFRRRVVAPQGEIIREKIERWATSLSPEIDWPEMPAEIQDRDADVWEPLIAVADLVGGDWPVRARVAAVALVAASKERDPSLGIRLLVDLKQVFGTNTALPTKAILQKLIELEESPWGDLKGRPLDERTLARRLKEYGVISKNLNVGRDARPKGYARADLVDAWARYLPPQSSDKSATSATAATRFVLQGKIGAANGEVADRVADVADRIAASAPKNINDPGHVADVADVAHLPGDGGPACDHCGEPGDAAAPLRLCGVDGEELHLHSSCMAPFRTDDAAPTTIVHTSNREESL